MEKYLFICVIFLGIGILSVRCQSCEEDETGCYTELEPALDQQRTNRTATCLVVNELIECIDSSTQDCNIITRSTMQGTIQNFITVYTRPPFACQMDFASEFVYDTCSQQLTACAFYKYRGQDLTKNQTEACRNYNIFMECMQSNTSACTGSARNDILQAVENITKMFTQCPYACSRDDLDCSSESSTPAPTKTTRKTADTTQSPSDSTDPTDSMETDPTGSTNTDSPEVTETDTTVNTDTTARPTTGRTQGPNMDSGATGNFMSAAVVMTSLMIALMS